MNPKDENMVIGWKPNEVSKNSWECRVSKRAKEAQESKWVKNAQEKKKGT